MNLANQFVQIHVFKVKAEVVALDSSNLQHFFHLIIEPMNLFFDDLGVSNEARVGLNRLTFCKHIGRNIDGRNRRFELVGHVVDEVFLEFGKLFLPQNDENRVHKKRHREQHQRGKKQNQAHVGKHRRAPIWEPHRKIIEKTRLSMLPKRLFQIHRFLVVAVINEFSVNHFVGRAIKNAVLKIFFERDGFEVFFEIKLQIFGLERVVDVDDVIIRRRLFDKILVRQLDLTRLRHLASGFEECVIDAVAELFFLNIVLPQNPIALDSQNAQNSQRSEQNDGSRRSICGARDCNGPRA